MDSWSITHVGFGVRHARPKFGTSKLAACAERLLGVEATARNWRTVTTLLEMAKSSP